MLYLDYSREADQWIPNVHGGRENLEAIYFLREMNTRTFGDFPGTTTIAEESTAWPQVSRPSTAAGWASATSGTWDGCTTRWNTCTRTRCTGASTTTR
jgi:1,4-alpha-glucan branching enzyme